MTKLTLLLGYNQSSNESSATNSKKRSAAELLDDEFLCESDSDSDSDADYDFFDSAGESSDNDDEESESSESESRNLAYMPCAAHNIQLVLNDGFDKNPEIIQIINKISKNVISKSSYSHVIAEELRHLKKKFHKKNATRWNSTLFMARSVLKLSVEDYDIIRTSLKKNKKLKKKTERGHK